MDNYVLGACVIESFLVIVDSAHWSFVIIITQINISRNVLLGKLNKTRMHSSRMRTGRSLTVCWSLLPKGGLVWVGSGPGGLCLVQGGSGLGGGSGPGEVWSWGVRGLWSGGSRPGGLVRGLYPCMQLGRPPLWTDTRLWKYYLGPTSLRSVTNYHLKLCVSNMSISITSGNFDRTRNELSL